MGRKVHRWKSRELIHQRERMEREERVEKRVSLSNNCIEPLEIYTMLYSMFSGNIATR